MHATRIELHDAFGIRQTAVADARILGIQLAQVHARDERVEDVTTFGHRLEGFLHTGDRPAVLVAIAVGRGHDDRLYRARADGRRLAEHLSGCGDGKAGSGAGLNEFAAGVSLGHGNPPEAANRSIRT
jgi:hypothetical protein